MIGPTELIGQNAVTEWKRSETPLLAAFLRFLPLLLCPKSRKITIQIGCSTNFARPSTLNRQLLFTAGVNPTLHFTNHVRRLFRGILSDFLLAFEE